MLLSVFYFYHDIRIYKLFCHVTCVNITITALYKTKKAANSNELRWWKRQRIHDCNKFYQNLTESSSHVKIVVWKGQGQHWKGLSNENVLNNSFDPFKKNLRTKIVYSIGLRVYFNVKKIIKFFKPFYRLKTYQFLKKIIFNWVLNRLNIYSAWNVHA